MPPDYVPSPWSTSPDNIPDCLPVHLSRQNDRVQEVSPDGWAAFAVCRQMLDWCRYLLGPEGKARFVAALALEGQACGARP